MTAPPFATLLDLDGTLIDSQPGIQASCEAALCALGHRVDTGLDVASAIGPPLEEMMREVLGRLGDDRVDAAVDAYRRHYGEAGYQGSTLYPGVADMLEGLNGLGVRLYVATSKRTVFARRILEHLGLASGFAEIYGSEPGGALDEKPALIAHILRQQPVDPARCQMVGDRRHDAIGARANKIASVGVLWGYGDRSELEAAGADPIIDRPAGLVTHTRAMLGR